MECVVKATRRLIYPQERTGTYCIGGCVGPKASLDEWGKSRSPALYNQILKTTSCSTQTFRCDLYLDRYGDD